MEAREEEGNSGDTTSLGDEKRQELAGDAAEGQRRRLGRGRGGLEGHEEGTAGGAGWVHWVILAIIIVLGGIILNIPCYLHHHPCRYQCHHQCHHHHLHPGDHQDHQPCGL